MAEIIVHCPGNILVGLNVQPEQLVLETIEGFCLLSAIHDPIVQSQGVIEFVVHARTHVVEGQKVKPIRA